MIAREKEDLKKGLESGKKRLQENGYILKETKPKTQKEVVKEKEQKQKKEIKKVEPKKAEEEVTKEPTKPKTEKAVKEAPKREKVESLVKTEERQKEFENKMNTLDQKAQEQYGKKFEKLTPKRQVEILTELESGQSYIKTSNEEILTKLGSSL